MVELHSDKKQVVVEVKLKTTITVVSGDRLNTNKV